MDAQSICRCCLSEGSLKDLDATYHFMDQKEVYSNMLHDCFDIILTSNPKVCSGICEWCIVHLRNSCDFKRRVLKSEREFMLRLDEISCDADQKEIGEVEVKVEMKCESAAEDSDDYFLADAARRRSPSMEDDIKMESTEFQLQKKPKRKATTKKQSKTMEGRNGAKSQKLRSLVNRLATSIKSGEAMRIPDARPKIRPPKPQSKTHTPDICSDLEKKSVTIGQKKVLVGKEISLKKAAGREKVKVSWKNSSSVKQKHLHNLQTILAFSNALVFKNKDILGYLCGYCEAAFPDPLDLRVHTENEHKKDRLICRPALDVSSDTTKLDIFGLQCTLCDEKMDNLHVLKDHLVKVHSKTIHNDIKDHILQYRLTKGDVYDCALCSATYETFKMLKQHMNTHYSNYICSVCNTAFATTRSLNSHKKIHIEGNFKCDQCDKVFSNTTKRQYHEKMAHLGARNISNCVFCDQPFRSYYQRNQHMIRVHNAQAQYKCNICDKGYILKSLLMNHIKKNHLMEKNFQCTECGHRFFSKKALKAHMVKHTGERNFACAVCHKCFARKFTLTEHMRIHNNDRRFKCTVCDLSFVQKCSLKSHLLSNHGISMTASEISIAV